VLGTGVLTAQAFVLILLSFLNNRTRLERLFPKLKVLAGRAKDSIQKGLTKKKLVISITLGLLGGIFPVLGTTTVLCIGLALIFRGNHAIVQLVNWLVYPLQILFLIPFLKFGSDIFGGPEFNLSINQVISAFQTGFFKGLEMIGMAHFYGVIAWLIVSIPIGLILLLLLNLFYDGVKRLIVNLK
jgi:uncharacterized protein (DUF2062 family)